MPSGNDPSFSLMNKTGAPQGEETGRQAIRCRATGASTSDSTFSGGGDDEGSAAATSVMPALVDGDRGLEGKGSSVGPFEILERIGPVAYRLRLPEELSGVHDTFHVSNLKKCLADASLHVPLDEIKVDKTLRFVEEPVEIMDREVKSLKRSRILLVKVH
ncbi:hypothetical protein Tco_0157872 [Tanacetum coccineum]